MKGEFYDNILAIRSAVTQVLMKIPLNGLKGFIHKFFDSPKNYLESNGDYFE